MSCARGRVFTLGLRFDDAEKRVLRVASIYPRSSVSCAVVMLRTRFTNFADHVAHSRPFVNTRPRAFQPHQRSLLRSRPSADTSHIRIRVEGDEPSCSSGYSLVLRTGD